MAVTPNDGKALDVGATPNDTFAVGWAPNDGKVVDVGADPDDTFAAVWAPNDGKAVDVGAAAADINDIFIKMGNEIKFCQKLTCCCTKAKWTTAEWWSAYTFKNNILIYLYMHHKIKLYRRKLPDGAARPMEGAKK